MGRTYSTCSYMDQSKIERVNVMSRRISLINFPTIGDKHIKGYADLLTVILKSGSPTQSFNPDTMRQALRLIDVIGSCQNEQLILDESDWEYIRNKVRVYPFKLAHPEVLEFIDNILDATEFKLEEVTSDDDERNGDAA